MTRVEFHPEAEEEFLAAIQFYEMAARGLGLSFVRAVRRTSDLLVAFPDSGHSFSANLERVLVHGFPYGLLYSVEVDRIYIVAVAHLNRRPGYWRGRV